MLMTNESVIHFDEAANELLLKVQLKRYFHQEETLGKFHSFSAIF